MSTITPQILLKAYAAGIFPMAESADDPSLYWIDPDQRGIIPLDKFHLSRRLKRTILSEPFKVTVDTAFSETIAACAEPRPDRQTTWINTRIRALYNQLFRMGFCHSVECWKDGELVGGLYGVSIGGAFFGESMFSRERDASKIALVYLVARLNAGGYKLLDTQFVTDHLSTFGAHEVDREVYHQLLEDALGVEGAFGTLPSDVSAEGVLQFVSQTS
ncbi:MAG: leucyl/phenylalanyl-tRNA--protein transferase [Pseudomonadota bacterium]